MNVILADITGFTLSAHAIIVEIYDREFKKTVVGNRRSCSAHKRDKKNDQVLKYKGMQGIELQIKANEQIFCLLRSKRINVINFHYYCDSQNPRTSIVCHYKNNNKKSIYFIRPRKRESCSI